MLAGCRSHTLPDGRHLQLSADPPPPAELPSGTVVRVTALTVPAGDMAWISGTVSLFGAPVIPFRQDAVDGRWRFKTMVPPMVTVPPGSYQVKAWGRTISGELVEGSMNYEVK